MINNFKPNVVQSVQRVTGLLTGTVAYNSSFAYNSTQPYGGFSGGASSGPNNSQVINTKPNL